MKKILSLLSMLMITVTAFATSYTDQLSYKLTVFTALTKNLPAGELTVEPYGTSNYTVTAKGCDLSDFEAGNWDEIVCEDVAGTTDANGVTTITLDNPYAYRTSDNATFTATKLVVKFNGTKAYAHFEGKMPVMGVARAFEYTFGTDEGFESTGGSTGGGETGGEDKPAIVDVVEADYAPNGAAFGFPFTINWETQKLVAKLDLSTCSRYTHNEGIITVGTDNGNGDVSLWNPNNGEANCHLYYTHYYYGSDEKLLNLHYLENPSGTVKRVDNSVQNLEPGLVVFTFDKDGLHVGDNLIATPDQMTTLYNSTSLIFGSKEGSTRSNATYKYVKVVPVDWTEPTEPTEPEVTVTFEKQYADLLYSLADGTPSAMGDATVTLKEMSDETVSMSLDFSDMNVESTDLVKGTDEKDRITYTGTANFQGTNYAVKAFRYTENEEEKLYMTLTAGATVLAFGSDPDYVAPGDPEDVTLWENYQADGTGFSKTATIDWDKQKIVASIDFSNGGDDKDILAMTTGESFAAFQTSTYRTMHWYCQQSEKQMSGFFAKDGAGNNNTGRMDVADCLAKFEISKAEGLKVNGEVKMSPEALDELFASNTVLIGSGESPKFSQAFYKYIKVVSLDWTETTTPDTPEAKVYKNTLKIVRGTDTKTYEDAEVSVLAKGEGKYEVVLPEFSDMDSAEGTTPGTIGKLTFVADGVEADGKLKLTASSVETTQEGGNGWESQTFTASMDATVENDQLAGTFTVVVDGYATMYTYNLYYGVEAPEVVTEVSNNNYTSNLRIIDQTSEDEDTYLFQTDEASVNIIKYSDNTYKITLRNITLNEKTSDLVFTGEAVGTEVDPDEGGAVVTDETMVQATADAETQNFLGGAVNAQFMWQDLSTTEIRMSFVLEGATLSLGGEFNYEEETPDQPKDDYAINFDKDAKQTHASRYSTSVSLQQTGKDKQTIEFGKTMNGYEDLTTGTDKFTVEAGSEVTPSIGYVGEWMHGYVYIDLDNNKQFSFNADGADQTGTDVVSYSYYKDQNSKGETVASSCNVNPMPAFTAPTEPGTYRIRFKVDWDNIDAGGSVLSTNHILNNGGGIYDATLEVVEPVVDGISTINAEVANGEAQLFTVDGVQIAKLQKGLNIVRSADGKVKKVLVK